MLVQTFDDAENVTRYNKWWKSNDIGLSFEKLKNLFEVKLKRKREAFELKLFMFIIKLRVSKELNGIDQFIENLVRTVWKISKIIRKIAPRSKFFSYFCPIKSKKLWYFLAFTTVIRV